VFTGFKSLPGVVQQWNTFTLIDKRPYSSAGLKPNWWKSWLYASKKEKDIIAKIAADWDGNPRPRVVAASQPPSNIAREFYHWPAIPEPSRDAIPTGGPLHEELSSKRPRIELPVDSLPVDSLPVDSPPVDSSSVPIPYDHCDTASTGCQHYLDYRHWEVYFET
jgi:hypothetical protein